MSRRSSQWEKSASAGCVPDQREIVFLENTEFRRRRIGGRRGVQGVRIGRQLVKRRGGSWIRHREPQPVVAVVLFARATSCAQV